MNQLQLEHIDYKSIIRKSLVLQKWGKKPTTAFELPIYGHV